MHAEQADLERQLTAAKAAYEKTQQGRQSIVQWKKDLKDLHAALNRGSADKRLETRLRMRVHLAELIDKIEIWPVGLKGKDDDLVEFFAELHAEFQPKDITAKEFTAFCKWLTKKRQSKDGRFLRVHFTTGKGIRRDLVPGDSIATGRALEVDKKGKPGWSIEQPSFETLWPAYQASLRKV